MKLFFTVALSIVFFSHLFEFHSLVPFTQQELDFFARLRFEDLPRRLQIVFRKQTRTGDNSHWCCQTDTSLPLGYTKISKIVSETIVEAIKVSVGSHSCGFFGSKTCHDEDVRYQHKIVTHLTYDVMPNIQQCSDNHVVCCKNFINVTGNCLELSVVHQYKDDLLDLMGAGLLG